MLSQRTSVLVFMLICYGLFGSEVFSQKSEDVETKFMDYIVQFNKSYRFDAGEYSKRFVTFKTSWEMINSMNKHRTHRDSARFGFTEYSDMSHGEFLTTKLNKDLTKLTANSITKERAGRNIIRYTRDAIIADMGSLPTKIDWRERGVVSAVRNQLNCGACWAHSVIETVESILSIERNSSTIALSVQQMIDCSANNNGCRGGDTCNLLEWLVQEKVNIQTMESYPMSNDETECKTGETENVSQAVQVDKFTCDSYVGQEQKILHLLANHGPVVTACNGLLWQNYLGGIIQFHCDGSISSLNHAVQIVGYDMTGDVPYYIVRNSWGERFGNKGYLKIQIGGNVCGLANQVSTLGVVVGSKD